MKGGYSIAPADSNLFVKQSGGKFSVVLIYEDDLIIIGDHDKALNEIKANLSVK